MSAQVAGGTIQGTITDPSASVITNAQVLVRNTDTGVERTIQTNAVGFYSAPNLVPGTYEVAASAPGFAKASSAATLTVGGSVEVNLQLKPGGETQQVEVTDAPAAVDTSNSALGGVVNSRTVVDLPLNGRDWTQLAALEPGVSAVGTQPKFDATNNNRVNRGIGAQMAIGGSRPEQNNYRVDGVTINDYANATPGGVLGVNLGVDAVREFSVITSNANASYGRSSGGIVNSTTRSGTNTFHGTAYEFLRNSAFDARNFFDGASIPPFKRNQFGASAGGPLVKNHTFFFADYEGLRQSLGTTTQINVPSAAARNGQLTAGKVTVDPKVKPYLDLYPLPNGIISGDSGTYNFVSTQIAHENFFTTRLDHTISASDFLHATYLIDLGDATAPNSFDQILIGTIVRRQLFTAEETHLFSPHVLNAVRVGYSRTVADAPKTFSVLDPSVSNTALGFLPGAVPGQITVTGLQAFPGGPGASGEFIYRYNSYQLYDDATVTLSRHSLQFGFVAEDMRSNDFGSSRPWGSFTFGSLSGFLTNKPTSFQSSLSPVNLGRSYRQAIAGGYFLDDWRLRPNLTVNLGLRYEMATVPSETHGMLATLASPTDPAPKTTGPLFHNPTRKNFEPRIGIAWDPWNDGKTSIRAAYGMYDVLPLHYQFELQYLFAAPYHLEGSHNNLTAGSFPVSYQPLTKLREMYVQQNPSRNYVMQWNLSLEREVMHNLKIFLGYIGSEATHQPYQATDMNMVLPALTPQGYVWPTPRGSGTVLNPAVGSIQGLFWVGTASYNGLQTKITKQLAHGFQVQGSYTWSKAIDSSSASVGATTFDNSLLELPYFNVGLERALSDFDVRHVVSASYLWQIPAPASAPAAWLSRGWTLAGIVQARPGIPFTPTIGGDALGLNSAQTFAFPDRIRGGDCNSAVNAPAVQYAVPGTIQYINTNCFAAPAPLTRLGNSTRNSMLGPGLMNFDAALMKNTPIHDRMNVQFQAQFFNVLNRSNFAVPATAQNQLFNQSGARVSTAGRITATTTSARQIQFALKFIW